MFQALEMLDTVLILFCRDVLFLRLPLTRFSPRCGAHRHRVAVRAVPALQGPGRAAGVPAHRAAALQSREGECHTLGSPEPRAHARKAAQ